ncbi:MAG: phosphoribosylformylglycinamidine synthase subunit PurS [Gemmatimonadaceae bacterium]
MNRYRVAVHIVPRRGLLDPQGKAVAGALHTLGFSGVREVRVGRHVVLEVEARDEADAGRATREMCERLLANPVTEDYEIASVTEGAAAAAAATLA